MAPSYRNFVSLNRFNLLRVTNIRGWGMGKRGLSALPSAVRSGG
ncbi:MAG: hypothetical protein RLZZ623_3902 [Actinomycetota bacterium]|jgi:hypothetical protein